MPATQCATLRLLASWAAWGSSATQSLAMSDTGERRQARTSLLARRRLSSWLERAITAPNHWPKPDFLSFFPLRGGASSCAATATATGKAGAQAGGARRIHPTARSTRTHARARARTHARTHALQELRPFLRCGVPPGTPERACRSAGGWGRKKGVVKRVQDIPRGARFMRKGGLEAAGATCGARARASAPRHQNVLSKHSARPEPSATSACAAAALCHLYTHTA